MFNLIKKDFLIISRIRSEVLVLLAMPMILIAVLGFALGGVMSGEQGIDKIPVALVMKNDFSSDMEDFEEALRQKGLPEEAIQQIIFSSKEADPTTIFLNLMESPELEEIIDIRTDYNSKQAEEAIMSEEVSAVITLPENFSFDTLMAAFLEEEPKAVIGLLVPDKEQLHAAIVENIITGFTEQYNLELSILQASGGVPIGTGISNDFGEITYLSTQRTLQAFQHYTIGIAVMFALCVASPVSINAFKEKLTHVFARLMITGERPLRYLLSKGISATALSIVQIMILFIGSSLIFQTFSDMGLESLIGMAVVTLIFSLTIGSLAALVTAVVLQFNNDAIPGIFTGVIVSGFAFIGGSMLPVEQLSPLLREIGKWTPNGVAMTAYLQLIQGFGFNDVLPMIYRLVVMMVIFIIIALAIFPKRRLS